MATEEEKIDEWFKEFVKAEEIAVTEEGLIPEFKKSKLCEFLALKVFDEIQHRPDKRAAIALLHPFSFVCSSGSPIFQKTIKQLTEKD